jgi:hypothetical protein
MKKLVASVLLPSPLLCAAEEAATGVLSTVHVMSGGVVVADSVAFFAVRSFWS